MSEKQKTEVVQRIPRFSWISGVGFSEESGKEIIVVYTTKKNPPKIELSKIPQIIEGLVVRIQFAGSFKF